MTHARWQGNKSKGGATRAAAKRRGPAKPKPKAPVQPEEDDEEEEPEDEDLEPADYYWSDWSAPNHYHVMISTICVQYLVNLHDIVVNIDIIER